MRRLIGILVAVMIAFGGSALASPKKNQNSDGPGAVAFPITEVDPLSITVSVAKDGNIHKTYKINDNSKVTIDGLPASVRELRAGMVAKISVAEDGITALSVDASDPKPKNHKHSWR